MAHAAHQDGLEVVVVAHTRLSDVDGEKGRLIIAGKDVEQLAGRTGFEDVARLLWKEAVPGRNTPTMRLGEARERAWEWVRRAEGALRLPDGMDALRAVLAAIPTPPHQAEVLLTGAMAVAAAAWWRTQQDLPLVPPDASLDHAADLLRMMTGKRAPKAAEHALDAYLTTVSDHGMNASTFAARVVASTGSDMGGAVVAGLAALKGPLHGGAPGPVLDMLDGIGSPEHAVAWLEAELLAGRRIMGMGHRVYRVRDPRAAVLETQVEALERAGLSTGRLALARAVEKASLGILRSRHPDRPLHANVEFYTAILLDTLGLHRSQFTPTFAVGRVAGWCAHVLEQQANGRLIRPASTYVGHAVA